MHGVAGLLSKSARPAAQSEQEVDPPDENCPMSHGTHGVAGSKSSSISPATHAVHSLRPIGRYVPAPQLMQEVAPAGLVVPAPHATHGVEASKSSSTVPTAQGLLESFILIDEECDDFGAGIDD